MTTLCQHATIADGTGPEPVLDQSVLVSNNQIAWIGSDDSTEDLLAVAEESGEIVHGAGSRRASSKQPWQVLGAATGMGSELLREPSAGKLTIGGRADFISRTRQPRDDASAIWRVWKIGRNQADGAT